MKFSVVQVLLLSKICLGELTNTIVENVDVIQDESTQATLEDPTITRFDAVSSMLSSLNFLLNKMIASHQQSQEYLDGDQLHTQHSNQQASPCSKSNSDVQSHLRGSYFIVSRSPVIPNLKQHGKQNIQLEGFYDSSSDSSVSFSSSDSSSGSAAYGYYGEYGEYGYYGDYGYYYDYGGSSSESASSSSEGGDEGQEDLTSSSVSVSTESDADVLENGEGLMSANEVEAIAPLSAPRVQSHRDFIPAAQKQPVQSRLRKVQAPQRFVAQKVQQLKPNHILLHSKDEQQLERSLDTKSHSEAETVQLKEVKDIKKDAKHAAKEEKVASKTEKSVEKAAKSETKAAKIAASGHSSKKGSKTFQEDVRDE